MKPVGIFGNNISKFQDIMRKRTPISLLRVPPIRSNKVKDYVSSVGSPCIVVVVVAVSIYIVACGLCAESILFPTQLSLCWVGILTI